ncbi:short-chain dehydrogenase [Thozetella sp. PMI_491]|nr:short-chain dehydrogenase [Thozetella sp. PMI_491]
MVSSKFVLITGCSSGIGRSLAYEFHLRGYHVIATARKIESIAELANVGMSTMTLDITSPESIESAKPKVEAITAGKLDVLVNNAGVTHTSALTDTRLDVIDELYHTNIRGPIILTQAVARLLVAAGPGSLVINISSASAFVPFLYHALYAMSKAALNSFGRSLSVEMAPFGVDVMTVVTGYIATPIGQHDIAQPFLPETSLHATSKAANNANRPFPIWEKRMTPTEYAMRVVNEVEKGPGWRLGPYKFGGRKDWLWEGTRVYQAWLLGNVLGEAWSRWLVMRLWGVLEP